MHGFVTTSVRLQEVVQQPGVEYNIDEGTRDVNKQLIYNLHILQVNLSSTYFLVSKFVVLKRNYE